MGVNAPHNAVYWVTEGRAEAEKGCLILLILAFVFRGAVISLLGGFIGRVIALLSFLLSLGFLGVIGLLVLYAIVAALG